MSQRILVHANNELGWKILNNNIFFRTVNSAHRWIFVDNTSVQQISSITESAKISFTTFSYDDY